MSDTRTAVSFDGDITINDKVNFDTSIISPSLNLGEIQPNYVGRHNLRPYLGGTTLLERKVIIEILVLAGSVSALKKLFDNSDGRLRIFLISDSDGSNRRYVECLCTKFTMVDSELVWRAELSVHGDIYYRAETESSYSWSITTSPVTLAVTNLGKLPAYPRLVFKPTTNKSDTNPYMQTLGVRWLSSLGATSYPVDITNGGLDTRTGSTNFSSATLADLRVYVDGVLVNFWTTSPNTVSTSIWVNLDFQPKQQFTLDGNVSDTDTVWVVNEDISEMPTEGRIEIAGEIAYYTDKNDEQKRFTGITRGVGNTTAAAHSDGDTVNWIQHNIQITYGATSPTAYATDNDYKPAFDLTTSTNTSHDYTEFGEDDELRTAPWQASIIEGAAKYTANQGTDADPWSEIGIKTNVSQAIGRNVSGQWSIFNPCGITNANFQSGEKYSTHPSRWVAYVRSAVTAQTLVNEYTIPAPSTPSVYEAWSQSVALTTGSLYVYMVLLGNARESSDYQLEASQVTLTLNSSNTPTVFSGSEEGNYDTSLTLTNESTSTAIKLDYQMDLNDEIEIDTEARTVTDLGDDSNQYQAFTKIGGVRSQWWELQPGSNNLKAEDSGMVGATLNLFWRVRYYD